jgi:hypothetical protein
MRTRSGRRRGLLVCALITVTVPGAVAVVAVAGHVQDQSALMSQAAAQQQQFAAQPTVPAPVPAAVPTAAGASGPGFVLLGEAAAAGLATSYRGVEFISRWTMAGTSTVLSNVWHQRGGQTVTQTSDAATSQAESSELTADPYRQAPEGVFGLTKPLVALLAAHYVARAAGTGTTAGRSALIVEVRRPGGGLAARFWLDSRTRLPLRREDYGADAQLIGESAFIQVTMGPVVLPSPALAAVAAASARLPAEDRPPPAGSAAAYAELAESPANTWKTVMVPAALLAKLSGPGFRLPEVLPGGLTLYTAALSTTPNGQVVALSYSDGLFEVSLFVQRGVLASRLAGWQQVKIAGRQVYVAARGLSWSGHGYVYTMLVDAPPQTVTADVAALPHDTPPGFWMRLGRGLDRLARLADPFH